MGALDTAKEIAKIAVTSGLSNEVIGLLEKKSTLLAEQVATLEIENSDLQKKVENLEQEIERLRPTEDGLDDAAIQFLKLLASRPGLRIEQIAQGLQVPRIKAEYHRDILRDRGLVGYSSPIVHHGSEPYGLTAEGRAYAVKHNLI